MGVPLVPVLVSVVLVLGLVLAELLRKRSLTIRAWPPASSRITR